MSIKPESHKPLRVMLTAEDPDTGEVMYSLEVFRMTGFMTLSVEEEEDSLPYNPLTDVCIRPLQPKVRAINVRIKDPVALDDEIGSIYRIYHNPEWLG